MQWVTDRFNGLPHYTELSTTSPLSQRNQKSRSDRRLEGIG